MKPFLVYDLEIKKAILGKNEKAIEGIEYCKGFDDHKNMGISCLCAFDYKTNTYRVFTDKNKDDFEKLSKERMVVGFNNERFDDPVVLENWDITFPDSIDLLIGIWAGVGLGPKFNFRTHGGYGLDACCEANFGVKKSGSGALAPVQWQRGEYGAVIDYCINDVYMTKRLFDMIRTVGGIRNPKDRDKFIPVNLFK